MNSRERFPASRYPFSDALCAFMDARPEFLRSLKLNNENRFEFLHVIFVSKTPNGHQNHRDEVIGLWYFDKTRQQCPLHGRMCPFKQDFIVNVKHQDKEFVSYSADNKNGRYVRPIREFFELYGNGERFYHDGKGWQHHYADIDDLPNEPFLRNNAAKILRQGWGSEKIKNGGFYAFS